MSYSESLGLENPKSIEIPLIKNRCRLRNREKRTTCSCGGCKCVLDSELGILVSDPSNKKHEKCTCVLCHVAKFKSQNEP